MIKNIKNENGSEIFVPLTMPLLGNVPCRLTTSSLEVPIGKVETDFACEPNNMVTFMENEILNMYAMVIDKKYTEFYGNSGRLLRNIGKQYLVSFNRFVIFKKTNVKNLDGDNVLIKNGVYKNKIGKLVKVYENNYSVTLNANAKKLNEIFVKEENGYLTDVEPIDSTSVRYLSKKIVKENLFNIDIVLKSGNYFQVKQIISEGVFLGKERVGNQSIIERKITMDEIEMIDFKIISKNNERENEIRDEIENENENENEIRDENEIEICDRLEEKEEILADDLDDEKEIDQYDDDQNDQNDVVGEEVVCDRDPEMKSTFKDSGRLNTMEKKLSDKENDILKTIEKCKKSLEYDIENKYTIIDKVNECVEIFKNELLKITKVKNNTDLVKKSDYTFVVAILLLYDLVKSGYTMQKSFDSYIEKLYNEGYIKGTFIS